MKKLALYFTAAFLFILSSGAYSLNIYCEDDAPFQFKGPDGKLTGMVVEMVSEVQKRVGNTDPIQMVPWARGLRSLDSEPDTLLFTMSRTEDRNDLYQWIGPVAQSDYAFYVKADSKISIASLEDAKKIASIGVYRDDVRDKFLTKAGFNNLDRTNDNVSNFKKLMSDRVSMYASGGNAIANDAERAGYKSADVKPVYVFLKTQSFIAASRKTDPSVVAKWNSAMEAMKKDGSFGTIFKKYYPNSPLPGPAITHF
ncbi:MAG: transporter substrate-binding domain-containing protein [Rhodoferax sp.]|nr:transporter substrate-binding domain-containing protein [Rhodoferax sp.]